MMEWQIVLTIVVLAGLIGTVVKPMLSLTRSITELTGTMQAIKEDLNWLTAKNTESHRRIWVKIDEQDERLNDHETRLTVIEKEKKE